MMKFNSIIIILFLLLSSGCAFNEMATKNDISEVQGQVSRRQSMLSEEVIALKRDVQALKIQVRDVMYQTEDETKKQRKTLQMISNQVSALQKDVGSLEQIVSSIRSEDMVILAKEVKQTSSKISLVQKELEKKLSIILEEVNKENARLSHQITSLQRRGSSIKRGSAKRPSDGIHVVERGESLSIIANRYGMTTQELADYNEMDDPDAIYVGQELQVPKD